MTVKKNLHDMYNRLDRIPAYDGRTDRRSDERTDVHGIVRAMHTRRAVKPRSDGPSGLRPMVS